MSDTSPIRLPSHKMFETNSIILLVGILIAVAIGGLVEIVPLFYLKNTIEAVKGVRPYSPLELAGFDIYVREGCYNCHSQMIRPLRDEVERYGHYSLAAESMYDHPFQWGSKRNGPDLARVGGKYSDDWHHAHLDDPRSVVPASIMPGYPFLGQTPLDYGHVRDNLIGAVARRRAVHERRHRSRRRRSPRAGRRQGRRRHGQALSRRRSCATSPASPRSPRPTRSIAYLQQLGAHVDFKLYDDAANIR